MQASHDVGTELRHLLQTCRDGQQGFETAANAIEDPSLQAELKQYSMQREDFALELINVMKSLGEPASDAGSVTGALHRGWMDIKAVIANNARHAVLFECERGEDAAIKTYRQVIATGLTSDVAALVESQYEHINRVRDRIKTLLDKTGHQRTN